MIDEYPMPVPDPGEAAPKRCATCGHDLGKCAGPHAKLPRFGCTCPACVKARQP